MCPEFWVHINAPMLSYLLCLYHCIFCIIASDVCLGNKKEIAICNLF